ncbi:MAG: hypothetical protein ABSF55_01710 [Candidatus Staskawiczbacteria bacterium]|jgi:hypothetical protein
MENQINGSNNNISHKREMWFGVLQSLIIFALNPLIVSLAIVSINSIIITKTGFRFANFYPPETGSFTNTPFMLWLSNNLVLFLFATFLCFNTIALLLKKNKNYKQGLLVGYFIPFLLVIILTIVQITKIFIK